MTFPTEQQVERIAKAMLKVSEPGCSDEWIESYWRKARASEHHETAPITCDHCIYVECMDNARAALEALAPEWREMEVDALRYRWLRDSAWDDALCCALYECTGDDMDAAIDAAREREG